MEEDANIAKVRRNVFKLVKVDGEANDTNRIAVIYSAKVGRDRTETNDRNDPKSRFASPHHQHFRGGSLSAASKLILVFCKLMLINSD